VWEVPVQKPIGPFSSTFGSLHVNHDIDCSIPYHAASRPRVIDKNQLIKSLEFRARDTKYEAFQSRDFSYIMYIDYQSLELRRSI
jgi:hypothetical protein